MNRVTLIGHLGSDAELRGSDRPVLALSLATSETWRDRESGERQERTTWHRVVKFGAGVEQLAGYLTKGRLIAVEGSIRIRQYTDRDGEARTAYEIVADHIELLGARRDSGDHGAGPASPQAPRNRATEPDTSQWSDDDIPF